MTQKSVVKDFITSVAMITIVTWLGAIVFSALYVNLRIFVDEAFAIHDPKHSAMITFLAIMLALGVLGTIILLAKKYLWNFNMKTQRKNVNILSPMIFFIVIFGAVVSIAGPLLFWTGTLFDFSDITTKEYLDQTDMIYLVGITSIIYTLVLMAILPMRFDVHRGLRGARIE